MAATKPSRKPAPARKRIPGEEHLSRRSGSPDWQIDFTIDGHRVRESCGTADKGLAAAYALRRYEEVFNHVRLGVQAKRQMTLNDAFVAFLEEVARHTTYGQTGQKYHMHVLLQALGSRTLLSELDDARINRLVQHLRAPREPEGGRPTTLSPATINRYITTLSVICARAREMWGVEVGAWTKAKHVLREPRGRELYLTHDDARRLLDAACGHLRPILLLELCTGLRAQNVIRITWEQIGLDVARARLTQKGDRQLTISLPEPAVRLLASLQPDPAKRTGPVFWFGNPATPCKCTHCATKLYHGQPITSVRRSFASAAQAAGVRVIAGQRLRFHDLRHTFASWLLSATGDLMLVRDALGHSQVATTQRYAHVTKGRKEAGVERAVSGLLESPAAIEPERKAG